VTGFDNQIALADLLVSLAKDVVTTQDQLDKSFIATRAKSLQSGQTLSPIWYRMENVKIQLELVTTVVKSGEGARDELRCTLPSPLSRALYGQAEMSSTRVYVEIAPIMMGKPTQ
jgi:hypothetical protein